MMPDPNGDWKMRSQDLFPLLKVIEKIIKVFTGKIH